MIGLDVKNAAHQCISFITSEPALKKSHFSGEVAALALPSDHSLSSGWVYQETKTTNHGKPFLLTGLRLWSWDTCVCLGVAAQLQHKQTVLRGGSGEDCSDCIVIQKKC